MLPLSYLGAATLGAVLTNRLNPDIGQQTNVIFLAKGPIHYDFVLPIDAQTRAAFSGVNYPPLTQTDAQTLIIGWGAEAFYTTTGSYRDISGSAIWRGIFGDNGVIRMDVSGPLRTDHTLRKISLTDAQYRRFLNALVTSFEGVDALPNIGFTSTDAFFPAKKEFNILNTCNVWIGEVLRSAGVQFGMWTPLPLSVTLSHRLYHPT
ncbi:uncharacterized protein (TIGR02117 family) [Sulfitobacter undariae]|uniref:Uncharacterized protein (TIGR02117 family) n=1 Tax=Sulfitobacter undariae TaxID=1563671 RepID=A0A7W6E951_9RHOB|nr:DUF2459 domain-containing protein [Sulfitobacter undariae]MBB3994275.1 uncharacterized protein (TIGR02117 family) [Sulfitobacter undariae]